MLTLFNEEKRNLAKQFAKLSNSQKMESYRLTSLFFLKQKNESSLIEAEPEFLDFFKDEIFLKMDKNWQQNMFALQSDHKYVEQLLRTASPQVLDHIEKHCRFYLRSTTFLNHFLGLVYDYLESP
jgi:hypothetical protein